MTNETNKYSRIALYLQLALVGLSFLAVVLVYPRLPDMIPMHWGLEGSPDNWWPKTYGAWLLPSLMSVFVVLFPALQKMDPRSENYPEFAKSWAIIRTSIIAMLAYINAIVLYVTLNPAYNHLVGRFVTFGVGLLFIVLGNYMGKVRQNYFVGLRTPWTLADPEVWQRSQRFAGWAFVIAGLIISLESFIWIAAPHIFIATIIAVVVGPVGYSYILSRKKNKA